MGKLLALLLAVLMVVTMVPTNVASAQSSKSEKEVVTYFANWYLDEKPAAHGAEVAGIPWDKVTYINHAFWAVAPGDGSTETTFERRSNKESARTSFKIMSTDPKSDYEDTTPSEIDPSMPRNHFAEYAVYSEKYPDVNIMISVGGWTDSGYFSEMAYTKAGRQTFVNSCIDLMNQYPWIDGIDIDWEYPGGDGGGERGEGDGDQGCPIFGTVEEDNANFAALLKDMKEAFDTKYGVGAKKLTSCASSSTGWTLPYQDWKTAAPYLDLINIMTYDMAGSWDGVTGHSSHMGGVKGAVDYFKDLGISTSKLNIGTPFYATGFMMTEIDKSKIVGAPIEDVYINGDGLTQDTLNTFESQAVSGYTTNIDGVKVTMGTTFDNGGTGWHYAYDSEVDASYIYNDDTKSEYYKYFISYESPLSLQAKLDYIDSEGLSGIIIWECSQDATEYSMITQMSFNMLLPSAIAKVYDANGNLTKNAIVSMTTGDGTTRAVYAKIDGTMALSEIITYNGAKYYCDNSGAIAANKIITCNASQYYASESGKLASAGIVTCNGSKYYVGKDSKIVISKMFTENDKQYYATKSGELATSEIVKYRGSNYYVNKTGAVVKGKWVTVGSKKYFCSAETGRITSSKNVK